jgi:hypothetical protein
MLFLHLTCFQRYFFYILLCQVIGRIDDTKLGVSKLKTIQSVSPDGLSEMFVYNAVCHLLSVLIEIFLLEE